MNNDKSEKNTTTSNNNDDDQNNKNGNGGQKNKKDDTSRSSNNNNNKSSLNNNNNNNKKKIGIRYAEKRRTSTCQFADRIAQISIDFYKQVVPINKQLSQTCLATIVSHNSLTGELHILSMGVGTKFLSQSTLKEEEEDESTTTATKIYGQRVRDCHAEVLARRGFCRFLCLEILDLLKKPPSATSDHDNDDDNNQDGENKRQKFIQRGQILERTTNNTMNYDNIININQFKLQSTITLHLYTSSAPCGNAVLKKFSKMKKEKYRDDLGPNEWPNMMKMMMKLDNAQQSTQSQHQQQQQQQCHHEPILGHSIHLGQFMLLVKKDNSINDNNNDDDVVVVASSLDTAAAGQDKGDDINNNPSTVTTEKTATALASIRTASAGEEVNNNNNNNNHQQKKKKRRKKVWPAYESDDWTPPGTTTTTTTTIDSSNKGSIHTCSDKICRWNYLGLQGSLLSSIITNPLYISTLTVGRKLTECICRRAVCCRLGENFNHRQFFIVNSNNNINNSASSLTTTAPSTTTTTTTTTTNCDSNDNGSCNLPEGEADGNYRVNHPSILGTAVYMDEFGAVETDADNAGQDVRFHSTLSWAWWRTSSSSSSSSSSSNNNGHNSDTSNQLECIDGRTGYLANIDLNDACKGGTNNETTKSESLNTPSLLCTWNLTRLFMEARSIIDDGDSKVQNDGSNNPEYYSSLSSLRDLKRHVSPYHEKTKDILLTKHKVLRDWNRRSKRSG